MTQIIRIFRTSRSTERILLFALLLLCTGILLKMQTETWMLFKGVLFTISLLIISFTDFKLQIIPNILLIPVICSGFIGVTWNSVAGLLFPSALFLMMAYFKNGIGGGDIKLMSACGFALGIYGAILAALIGLLLFLIVHLPTYLKHKNKVYALAPCLSVGCFVVFNMIGG